MTTTISGTDGVDNIKDNTIATADIQAGAVTAGKLSQPLTLGTAQNTTSGTAIDFTSIPSWVKRITVMLNAVSTNGTSVLQVQIGAGSIVTTGYNTGASQLGNPPVYVPYTSGFGISVNSAASSGFFGVFTLHLLTANTWVFNGQAILSIGGPHCYSNGYLPLGSSLDRIRLTTVNGTDAFDSGSVNILYE